MAALQQFFDAERIRRGWSMRETASRSKMSVSKAYAIANGDDNVEFETFENIALAFNMSPAELAAAIGKGGAAHDPDEAETLSIYRQVPKEHRPTVKSMLRGIAGMSEPRRVTAKPKGFGRPKKDRHDPNWVRRLIQKPDGSAQLAAALGPLNGL